MGTIEKKIQEAEKALQQLRKQKEHQDSQPEEVQLAEWMHEKFCYSDHTEYCGWYYDKDWSGYTKKSYLEKATALLKIAPLETIKDILVTYKKL